MIIKVIKDIISLTLLLLVITKPVSILTLTAREHKPIVKLMKKPWF